MSADVVHMPPPKQRLLESLEEVEALVAETEAWMQLGPQGDPNKHALLICWLVREVASLRAEVRRLGDLTEPLGR